ncbi:uncharacterized protein LOC122634455 isoform X6 [Vespula pensylvanica]|uniref:uncharacterized protein LOC122634455 isoform X6 n=1 Tax=Vespula pensylvanica TaxID=30213 RepID=UPI001CB9F1D9|nr:uncharacterized protein LOC122634455 isoform X6 [Vespula pensylvanica]XP_050853500.1 uncharacterized protein LOC127065320 isoform X6 [Vespula vulgaris]
MLEFFVQHAEVALSTEDVRDDGTQDHEKEPDQPVDSVYMICGVLIAMVLVGVIIVLLAVTISKLRKREEHHSNVVHPENATVVQTATVSASSATISTIVSSPPSSQLGNERCLAQVTTGDGTSPPSPTAVTTVTTATTTTTTTTATSIEHDGAYPIASTQDQFVWQFPPPYPPQQYTLSYNDQDALVHTLPAGGRPGFAKGFRKNFGGHWRRLVKRKPETETCAIPPELKDQLKTIYVY